MLKFMGLQRVGHDLETELQFFRGRRRAWVKNRNREQEQERMEYSLGRVILGTMLERQKVGLWVVSPGHHSGTHRAQEGISGSTGLLLAASGRQSP